MRITFYASFFWVTEYFRGGGGGGGGGGGEGPRLRILGVGKGGPNFSLTVN